MKKRAENIQRIGLVAHTGKPAGPEFCQLIMPAVAEGEPVRNHGDAKIGILLGEEIVERFAVRCS